MRLRSLFLEEVKEDLADGMTSFSDSDYDTDMVEEVNTDGVTQDEFIQDIYDKNNLSDTTRSIFKVEELMNSLPKEMPTETKKITVSSIMSSFGLTIEEVSNDAAKREEIIKNALRAVTEENNNSIANNEALIEQKKIEIGELEKDNSERKEFVSDVAEKANSEMERLNSLLDFIC